MPRAGLPLAGRRAAHRADSGRGGANAHCRAPHGHRARLHGLPPAPRHAAGRRADAGGRAKLHQRIPHARRLAGERQRQPGLFAGRPHPERGGQGHGQLLALACVCARNRPGAPRGRHSHSRSGHAQRLLRGLVAAHAAHRRAERRAGQGGGRAAKAHVFRRGADRQFPGHAAKRMGGRAGVFVIRHLHGPLRAQGRHGLRRRAPVHAGDDLQPERAFALGHANAFHQPHLRLGVP